MARLAKKKLTAAQQRTWQTNKIQKMATDISYIRGWMVPIAQRHSAICKELREIHANLQLFRAAETERFALLRDAINTLYDEMPKARKPNGISAAKLSPPDAPGSPVSADPSPPPDQTPPSA